MSTWGEDAFGRKQANVFPGSKAWQLKEYKIQGTLKFRHSVHLCCVNLNSHNLKVES